MTPASIQFLDETIVDAVGSIFGLAGEAVTVPIRGVLVSASEGSIAATVGFTSAEVRGAVVTMTSAKLIAAAWPRELRSSAPGERDISDWAGELTNQLVGRLKNRLAASGLVLVQSTPTVIVGRHLDKAAATGTLARRYVFQGAEGVLVVCLDIVTDGHFDLHLARQGGSLSAPEGHLELF